MRKEIRFWVLAIILGGIWSECVLAGESACGKPVTTTLAVYDGWVHVQVKKIGSDTSANTDDPEGAASKPPEVYINQTQEVLCTILDFGSSKLIRYQCPKTGQMSEFDSKYNGVAFGTMSPGLIQKTRREIEKYPLTAEAHMALLKDAGAVFVRVDESMDKGLKRIEISFIGGENCRTCPQDGGLDILWVDPKTNLIQKMQTQLENPQEITLTYDRKERTEIYDFGVPRNATILDSRPTPQAVEVLNRFDQLYERGFGDFVGVLTETDHRKEWGTKKMFLYLYIQEGNNLFYGVYGMNESDYSDSPMMKIAGWPKVDIREALERAGKTIPQMYYATDGKKVWTGRLDSAKENAGRMSEGELTIKENPPLFDYFLVHQFWRSREALYLNGYGPRADTLTDKAHPGLIGLRLREGDFGPGASNVSREEKIFWVDPKRNDVPVQKIHRGERLGTKLDTLTQFDTRFQEFAQLSNGTWYPTRWTTQASREDFIGKTKGGYSREFSLQVLAGMKVDKTWFGSRAKAMGIKAAKMSFKSDKK